MLHLGFQFRKFDQDRNNIAHELSNKNIEISDDEWYKIIGQFVSLVVLLEEIFSKKQNHILLIKFNKLFCLYISAQSFAISYKMPKEFWTLGMVLNLDWRNTDLSVSSYLLLFALKFNAIIHFLFIFGIIKKWKSLK